MDSNIPQLKSVVRLDSMPLSKAYFTPEGFLMDKPVLTSTGIFEYRNRDGSIRRELRLPEDVFAPESLKSYKARPIIITHDAGLIDKDNVAENQIGTILSYGERSGDDVVAEIVIHDTDAMKSAGLKELSLGYNLDLDETPGVWNGQHYDAVQKNIRINHLALVREARAGEQARLNLDGRDNYALKGGKTMGAKKIRKTHHGDDVLTQEEFEKAIDEYKQRKAEREGAQADAEDVEEVEAPVEETIETKVQAVKDRRNLRDEAGDPKDEEEALTTIAHQDEDIDILFDIIDTMLAQRDMNQKAETDADDVEEEVSEEETVEEVPEDVEEDSEPVSGIDDMNKFKKNTATDEDDEIIEEEEEELVEDEDDVEDEDLEDDEFIEDEDDVEEEEEELPEDEEMDEDDIEEEEEEVRMNADSVDEIISRGIRNHMAMGKLGRKVGLKGLENKNLSDAKKAIIKAVNPGMRLDGKSDTYINAAFSYAKRDIMNRTKKDTEYQKKQMFNKDSAETMNKDSAKSARERMIARQLGNK